MDWIKDEAHKILVYDRRWRNLRRFHPGPCDGVFEVLSTNGNTKLGGDDFDERVMNYIADEFKKSNGIGLRSDKWLYRD